MRTGTPAILALLIAGGCAGPRVNPSFPVSLTEARADWQRMCREPAAPPRPILVVGGYGDPGLAAMDVATRLRRVLGKDAIVMPVQVGMTWSMDGARDRLVRIADEQLASRGRLPGGEVDVVAISMGGLVARYAAVQREGESRLHVARLFTISSPHRGARLAGVPSLESRVRDMRAGSEFLGKLDSGTRDFEMVPYARLNDWIVGEENMAPPDMTPWWVDTPMFEASHLQAHTDARILADIARRLRGEEPLTHAPATALPGRS